MPLDVLAVALCFVLLAVVVTMLVIALTGIADPAAIVRCHECSRWVIVTSHREIPLCFRCWHGHHRLVHHHRAPADMELGRL